MNRVRTVGVLVAASALVAPLVSFAADPVPAPCAAPVAPDEWATFGGDLANTRTQREAGELSPATVPTLEPAWAFTTGADFAGISDLNGTPIVAGGCVFLNTAAGDVIALDAGTGAVVWRTHVAVPAAGLGGDFVSSPAYFVPPAAPVEPGKGKGKPKKGDPPTTGIVTPLVIALVNQLDAPYALALSATDGSVVWSSAPLVDTTLEGNGKGYYTNATAVVHDGLLLAGFSPAEGDPLGQGGITLIDATTGAVVRRVYSIPEADQAQGYAGGGIWTAPAVDTETGYAYAGTSNPYSKKIEHGNTNAILKIDIDRARPTFGTVVGSYKGLIEQYDPVLRQAVDPACEALGEHPNLQLILGDSAPCLQLDLDFGTPPNLFRDSSGRLLIGDLQKAGVYHAADAATMAPVWKATVGVSCAACNAAAWAFDGTLIGANSPGDAELSISADDGAVQWASPIADGTHYQSTSVAGGVAFTIDNYGVLHGWDAATGVPLLKRPVQADAGADGTAAGLSSAGIAVSGGQVIVAAGTTVVAYRPAAL